MREYAVFTDSACDIKPETLREWGVGYRPLKFRFEGDERDYDDHEMDISLFYGRMRSGETAKTSGVNVMAFVEAFEEILKNGKDILYLGFSSGLSTTYNSGRSAAAELLKKYPERRIRVVDTLSASAGQGLLLYLTLSEKEKGADLDEAADFAERTRLRICHWFTVEDLVYLKRGGRVSSAAAFVGNTLGIKPVMHMDNAGHLVGVSKVRGRMRSITALADKYDEYAVHPEKGPVFISEADSLEDAKKIAAIIKQRHGTDTKIITDVGPVIGAHSGPGTLALFFVGKER